MRISDWSSDVCSSDLAWRRAERGETCRERHLAFESWDALSRVLTAKRLELLRYVHRHQVPSVRALAKALSRDYSNVHADVEARSEERRVGTESVSTVRSRWSPKH